MQPEPQAADPRTQPESERQLPLQRWPAGQRGSGAAGFIVKPVDYVYLLSKLTDLLGNQAKSTGTQAKPWVY